MRKIAHPFCLLGLLLLGHPVANAVRIPKCPYRELMKDANLGKHVEIQELVRFLFIAERVRSIRRLRIVLAAGVLIEIVEAVNRVLSMKWPR